MFMENTSHMSRLSFRDTSSIACGMSKCWTHIPELFPWFQEKSYNWEEYFPSSPNT